MKAQDGPIPLIRTPPIGGKRSRAIAGRPQRQPRRAAYNWAKSGRFDVLIHRARAGRLVVVDDSDGTQDSR